MAAVVVRPDGGVGQTAWGGGVRQADVKRDRRRKRRRREGGL